MSKKGDVGHNIFCVKAKLKDLEEIMSFIENRVDSQPEGFETPEEFELMIADTDSRMQELIDSWDVYIFQSPGFRELLKNK